MARHGEVVNADRTRCPGSCCQRGCERQARMTLRNGVCRAVPQRPARVVWACRDAMASRCRGDIALPRGDAELHQFARSSADGIRRPRQFLLGRVLRVVGEVLGYVSAMGSAHKPPMLSADMRDPAPIWSKPSPIATISSRPSYESAPAVRSNGRLRPDTPMLRLRDGQSARTRHRS
jgi:hypothetical protein